MNPMMNERTFSHLQAYKLDAPERREWLPVSDVMDALHLQTGSIVADIGAGTGYFTLPMATAVGESGKVWAIDMQPEMLAILSDKLRTTDLKNVECRQGVATKTGLSEDCCDVILMANLWHELDERRTVLEEAWRILRPGGRIAVLDWSPIADQPPGPPLEHRIPSLSVSDDLAISGFHPVLNRHVGAFSYLIIADR